MSPEKRENIKVRTQDKASLSRMATAVDRHVGNRIREKRQERGVTQQELSRALGISYQQVQKYENGANRVSAGRLYILAEALGTTVGEFFSGFGDDVEKPARILATSEEAVQAAKELHAVKDPRVRNSIRALVRILGSLETDPRNSW